MAAIITPITGPRSELDYQYQLALGEIDDRIQSHWLDPRDFGAVCDDSTDDAAALQAAIDYAGSTAATRGGAQVVVPDHMAIGSTITIDRKSIILRGLGWGRRGQSGVQPYLRWIGSAGSPMLRIKNVQGVQVRDLRLLGKSTAKPSCAISLYQVSGFGINQNVLENISIGDLIDDAVATGTGVVNGIAFEGATANNDTWYFENISINGCSGYVLRQNSTQNVNCILNKLTATDSAEGLYIVGGEFTGRGWNFGAIAGTCIYSPAQDDDSVNCYPNIHVIGLLAERSGRLLKMDGQGVFTAESGHFQRANLIASDGRIVIADAAYSNRIAFRNFNLNSAGSGSPSTEPYIDITLSGYENECFKELILENVALPSGGPNSNGIDAQSLGVLDWKHIKYAPPSNGTSGSYVTPQAFDVWLGGQFGTAESLSAKTTDIPARFRFPPTYYQAIALAANQILLDTALRLIANRTGSPITLTSTPTIPAGRNGEVIMIVNVGASAVTLQDEGTLTGSKLRLGSYGPTLTLSQYQSAEFLYLSTDQTGFESTNAWVLQRTTAMPTGLISDTAYNATSWNGVTDVAPSKNAVRDQIELLQPLDSDLTAIAALTPTNDDIIQRKAGAWTNRTIAQLLSDLGLGALYQPLDSDLTAIAALSTTSFGRAFLTLADAAAGRSAIDAAQLSAANSFVGAQTILDSPPTLRLQRNSGTTTYYGSMGFYSSNGTKGFAFEENFTVGNDFLEINHGASLAAVFDANGNFNLGTSSFGASAAKVLGLGNATAPSSSPASMVQLWSDSGELKVRDSSGNVTTLSPHAGDAPEFLYDDDAQPPHISREANMFAGTIRFVNHTRAARLQQRLFDGQSLPKDPLKRKTIHEETFAEYNKRLGLSKGDPQFLVQESWDANEELNQQQQEAAQEAWSERRKEAAKESSASADVMRVKEPEPYQKRARPSWLK